MAANNVSQQTVIVNCPPTIVTFPSLVSHNRLLGHNDLDFQL